MLSAFTSELESTQSELEILLAKVEALRGQMKSLKATGNKVSKVLDSLKTLLTELPQVALTELKKEILSLFPSNPEPTKEPAPTNEVLRNFMTEVPKIEAYNPSDFEPMEYQSEDNRQLNLLELIPTEESSISKVEVSELCFYLKKPNQEIVAAYLAIANRNVGKEWADYLNLMGCSAKVRKAENFDNGVRWEIKATRISHELILQVDKARSSLYSAVPAGNQEYTKKLIPGKEKTGENFSGSKTPVLQSDSQPEKNEISIEEKANKDAEIPKHFYEDERKCFPNDLIRVNRSCHHASVIGLTGKVVTSTPTGCVARFEEIGNRWLTNDQFEIIKEQFLVNN